VVPLIEKEKIRMNEFCVQVVCMPQNLRPDHGIVRTAGLVATADATKLVAEMLAQARQDAAQLRAVAHAEAQQAVRHEQQEIARKGSLLLEVLQGAQHDMLERVGGLVVDLAQEVFDRLLLELTPRERIAAMLRRIRQEAPSKLREGVLWVHPDDRDLLPESPWEVQVDAALAVGSCRLEAASGEWRADFSLAAQALRDGLAGATQLFQLPSQD
jgi:flagellar biosynthesis/type III secretory pathway protein FliH